MIIRMTEANDELEWLAERAVIYFKVCLMSHILTLRSNTIIKGVKSSNKWQDNNKVDIRLHCDII